VDGSLLRLCGRLSGDEERGINELEALCERLSGDEERGINELEASGKPSCGSSVLDNASSTSSLGGRYFSESSVNKNSASDNASRCLKNC
jgi:hypothetical protein